VIYFLLRSFLGPKSISPTSPAALRFRVLFTNSGCRLGDRSGRRRGRLTGDTGSGPGRWLGLLAGAGCGRRRGCLTGEFASTFATFDTTFVAVAIASITSLPLAIVRPAL
jgi:hypothetical protein